MTTTIRSVGIRDVVRYFDEFGNDHIGIVTNIWGEFYDTDVWTEAQVDQEYEKYCETMSQNLMSPVPRDVFNGGREVGSPHVVPSLNLVCVDKDENKTDQYGRQIFRPTSVPHKSVQAASGRYWENFNLID